MVEHAQVIENLNEINLQMEYKISYCLLIYSMFFVKQHISAPKHQSKIQIAPLDKACLTFF